MIRTLVFLSGKGGSGKTTAAIAFAKLLTDVGLKVLLIDLDLATSGASYFFRDEIDRTDGILETLGQRLIRPLVDLARPVRAGFLFVPSRVTYDRALNATDISRLRNLFEEGLSEVVLAQLGVDYVLIDCGAGYSPAAEIAASLSDTALLVTEPDAISNDTAETLLIQLGNVLPKQRRYLVNKIDIRDAETYAQLRDVFTSMNRLPPLPFDFAVREAFGSRHIPLDVDRPSALLFALLETSRVLFPEVADRFETYRETHTNQLFAEYNRQVEEAIAEKRTLEEELGERDYLTRRRLGVTRRLSLLYGFVFGVALLVGVVVLIATGIQNATIWAVFGVVGGLAIVVLSSQTLSIREWSFSAEAQERDAREARLAEVNRQLDNYRSLLIARSRDYLLDAEVARRVSGGSSE